MSDRPQKTCCKCHRPGYASYKGKYYCSIHLEENLGPPHPPSHNEGLANAVKAEELLHFTDVIKEKGERKVEYLSQNELEEYFDKILIELPDFEYIRLKKSTNDKNKSDG